MLIMSLFFPEYKILTITLTPKIEDFTRQEMLRYSKMPGKRITRNKQAKMEKKTIAVSQQRL